MKRVIVITIAAMLIVGSMSACVNNPYTRPIAAPSTSVPSDSQSETEESAAEEVEPPAMPTKEEVASRTMTAISPMLKYYEREDIHRAWGEPDGVMDGGENGWIVETWRVGEGADTINIDVQFRKEDGKVTGGFTYLKANEPTIW